LLHRPLKGNDIGVDRGRQVLRYRWVIFSIMCLAYYSVVFHRVSTAVVALDLQRDFGISAGLVGLLASAYFYSYAVAQLPAGLLSDSLGPRKTAGIFLILGGIGSIIFGFAPNVETAVLGRVIVGLGAGMVFAPALKIVSRWFRVNEFVKMNSFFLATGGLGAVSAAEPLAMVSGWIGWRASFELLGLAAIAVSILVWVFVRDQPQDLGWPSLAEIDPVYGKTLDRPQEISLLQGVRRVTADKYFWLIALWYFFSIGIFFAFGGLWAGPYLTHVYGLSREESGSVLNMLAIGIVVGSLLLAHISDKVLCSRKQVLIYCSTILVALLIFLNVWPLGLPKMALYPIFFAFAISSVAPGVVAISSTKELFPVEITGTSVGMVNLFPFVGGAVIQLVIGWVIDAYPQTESGVYPLEAYQTMFEVFLGSAVVGLIATFLMKETYGVPAKR
jgi:sugar phosphate permease